MQRFLLGLIVSVIAIVLSLRGLDFTELTKILPKTDLYLYGVATFLHFISYFIRGYRWRVMLQPVQEIEYRPVLGSLLIGFMANNILPARLGEIVRAIVLGQRTGVSRTMAFSSVILERFFDGAATVMIALVSIVFIRLPQALIPIILLSSILFLGIFSIYYFLYMWRNQLKKLYEMTLNRLSENWKSRLIRLTTALLQGFYVLHAPKQLVNTVLTTAVIWCTEGASYHLTFLALGIPATIPMTLLTMVAINLSVMVPSAPGYIGVFEYASILAIVPFGFSKELALSFSLLSHAVRIVVPTLMGGAVLYIWGMQFRELSKITSAKG